MDENGSYLGESNKVHLDRINKDLIRGSLPTAIYERSTLMDKELTKTTFAEQKVLFGEMEFTNLVRVLIRVYQFNNKNQNPKAVVMPDVKEVDGVRVEFPKPKKETLKEK